MNFFILASSFAIAALSTRSTTARSLLLPRDESPSTYPTNANSDDRTQVIFSKTVETYSKTVSVVEDRCQSGDTKMIYESLTVLETSMSEVEQSTQQSSFDSHEATNYKESVVEIVAGYSRIVTVLSTYPEVENGCHESLISITTYTQTLIDVYLQFGMCLEEEIKTKGGLNLQALNQLHLQLNLKGSYTHTQATTSLPSPPIKAQAEDGSEGSEEEGQGTN